MLSGERGIFQIVQTFWGLAVIAGLGSYSLFDTIDSSGETLPSSSGSSGVSEAFVPPTMRPTPRPRPVGGYPTPSPLNIFLACDGPDGDAARFYVPSQGGYVILRIDTDSALVTALLAGEQTWFPANANLIQTPCVRSRIRAGTFP